MPYKDEDKAREYQREYRRARRAGESTTPGTTRLPADFRLKTAADVLALLDDQVDAILSDESLKTLERARVIGYLCGVSLKAIEAGDLAARLEAIELVMKQRKRK